MSNQKPRAEMAPQAQPADPCVLVIFGAAGDLTKRLLVPALYNLRQAKLLPEEFAVIGVSRNDIDNETFRRDFGISLRESGNGEVADGDLNWLGERLYHLQGERTEPAALRD